MDLTKLLKAKSMVIIGASENPGFGGDTCRNILTYRKDLSRVYFVHPKRDEVFGRKCYKSVSDIEDTVELVIICTAQKTVIPLLYEARQKGCGGAVVYASGYSEVGTKEGIDNEKKLIDVARELDIAIMGPNCGGFVNFIDDVYSFAFVGSYENKRGRVGFVSQSGQFCIDMMNSVGMKYSYAISAGNSRVVQMGDYLNFLIEDKDTSVIAIYLEGVKDPHKFEQGLKKAAKMKKPVIVLKAGRSPKGEATAASHTGSMAGSDKTYDAIFAKYGVVRVDDMQDLRSTASLFATLKTMPKCADFASISLSGGETGICADTGYLYGINYPDFSEKTMQRLRELLPGYATPRNPLDMTAMLAYDADEFAEGISAVMEDENVSIGFIGWTIAELYGSDQEVMLQGILKAVKRVKEKPLMIASFMEASRNTELVGKLEEGGVAVLPTTKYAFSALRHLSDFIGYHSDERTLELAIPQMDEQNGKKALSEYKSKKMLADAGINIEAGIVALSQEEAVRAAEDMGYPVVLKIDSDDIMHKSDVGGVRLNIGNAQQVCKAYTSIMDSVAEQASEAALNGILVQKMLPKGVEMIVGVKNDKQFGPMLLVGLGGIFVEIFKDVTLYPVPLNRMEAKEMISSLKAYKLLTGYRGAAPADIAALVDMMVTVSDFAAANKDTLLELDINPLFVYERGKGVGVADALVVLKE